MKDYSITVRPIRKFKHKNVRLVATIAALLLAPVIAIQLPSVQTAVADRILEPVRESMNGDITFRSLKILPFNTIIVRDFLISDKEPYAGSFFAPQDTVLYVHKAVVRLTLKGLTDKEGMKIRKVTVSGGQLSAVKDGDGMPNFPKVFNKVPPSTFPEMDLDRIPVIRVGKVAVHGFKLRILDPKLEVRPYRGYGINWADFEGVADAYAHDIYIHGINIDGILDDFNVVEKSGYRMLHADGEAEYRQGHATVTEFHMKDPWSELYLPKFEMIYDQPVDFKYYVDSVKMRGAIRNSAISLKTVGYFGQTFEDATTVVEIPLSIFEGTANDLSISEFIFNERHGVRGRFNGKVHDAAVPGKLSAQAEIKRINFTTSSLSEMINSTGMAGHFDIGKYAPGEHFTLKGDASGRPDRISLDAVLTSAIGSVTLDGSLAGKIPTDADLSMLIHTDDLDIGAITGNDNIRQCTLGSKVRASLRGKDLAVHLDSLSVSRLNLLKYDYSGIAAAGTYSGDAFDGRIISTDPNLNFLFQGIFNLSGKTRNAIYRFYCNIGYADLHALHLDNRGVSRASAEIQADYVDIDRRQVIGSIDIKGLNLENKEGNHDIGDISIVSRRNGGSYKVNLASTFANASFSGPKSVIDLIDAVQDLTTRKSLPLLYDNPVTSWDGESYSLDIKFSDTRDILSFVLPGGYLADGTTLRLNVSDKGALTGNVHSQRIALEKNFLKNIDIAVSNEKDSLNLLVNSGELCIGETSLLNNIVKASASDNGFNLRYRFDNLEEADTKGDLDLCGWFDRENGRRLILDAQPSDIHINGHHWEIDTEALQIDSTGIRVDSLGIHCGKQSMNLWGGYSKIRKDTLNIDLNDFMLGPVSDILGTSTKFSGNVSGNAIITSPFSRQAGMVLDVRSDSTFISGHEAGTLFVSSRRSKDSDNYDVKLSNHLHGRSSINGTGKFYPERDSLAARVKMDNLCIGYLSGLASGTFSDLDGSLSGDFSLIGPVNNLSIYSRNGRIDDGLVKIAFTEVPYHVSGPFHIDDNGAYFDDIQVRDGIQGTGIISGGLKFNHLKDMRMAMHVDMTDMLALNKKQDSEEAPVYGTVFANGSVDITGPFDALVLSAEATTTGESDFFIPLGNGLSTANANLLTFKEKEIQVDPYEEMMRRTASSIRKIQSGLALKLRLSVTPDVLMQLNLDKSSDNGLKGRGRGDMTITLPPSGEAIDIRGNYTLNEGNFHFGVAGLAKRDFTISNGSNISFIGDIMESDMDINAIYTTKTSVDRIFGDESAVASRRTVNCGLHVFDKLRNPQLGFSIDVPDLSPEAQSYLLTAINTEDKLQKQFLSLIVSNSFLPNEEAGIVNNTNVLLSNAAEIMAGQLNNIFQMLKIPLDLGLNYQQASGGTNIFDVAVSTQLFNNRVSVNGTFGNRMNTTSQQDFVGDLDIEMKLDKSGNIRASLFSHSADRFTNYLDNSQRNGVGISYQTEFNDFREFVKDIFSPKKEREARRAARSRNKTYKTINITNEGND